MATLLIRLKVKDFATWKSVYDKAETIRKDSGVIIASIHRDPDDPNIVIVMHQFEEMDIAFAFADSDELRQSMEQAGVIGQPERWFGEDVELSIY